MGSTTQTPPRKRGENREMSPGTLQRKYLPRRDTIRPTTTHQAAAAAAVSPQEKPPRAPVRPENQTKSSTTSNRTVQLTRFKPGFEQQTEYELSCIFCRPMRTYKEDLPFYPYLVPEPIVNFNLNYKC